MKKREKRESEASLKELSSRFFFLKPAAVAVSISLSFFACSLFKTRPVQEFSDTAAAMKAAKVAQADLVAPVLYREASEWWTKAKAEYRYKNFEEAEKYAVKARKLAEQAEFETLKNPAPQSVEANSPDTPPTPPAYEYAKPVPVPYDKTGMAPPQTAQDAPKSTPSGTPGP